MHEIFRPIIADIVDPRRRTAALPFRASWHVIDQPQYAMRDVVDIGEVALHLAMVKERDRRALHDRLGEQIDRHVRPAPRPIYRKKSQSGAGEAVKIAIGMVHT